MKNYISTAEAAEALGVAEQTVRSYLKSKKLKGRRLGGKFRALWQVEAKSVRSFLESGGRSERGKTRTREANPAILGDEK